MDHYIDLSLQQADDIGSNELMAHLFYKVHVWLAAHAQGRIGLSFPAMQKTPGHTLRVHGSTNDLQHFAAGDWRNTVALWLAPAPIQAVPAGAQACSVRRVQHKSAHNRRQRSIAKGWLTPEQAQARIPDNKTKPIALPFLDIRSASTGQQRVRFFIQQLTGIEGTSGSFTAYGMGREGATVPWF